MKHACPYCIEKPFERLCNKEYLGKYPANHVMYLGQEKVYICDQHFEMLIDAFGQFKKQVDSNRGKGHKNIVGSWEEG